MYIQQKILIKLSEEYLSFKKKKAHLLIFQLHELIEQASLLKHHETDFVLNMGIRYIINLVYCTAIS